MAKTHNNFYKVVVVEDEPIIKDNIIQKIQNANTSFIVEGTAENGKEALQIIRDIKPHILFTDIKMPIMDGLELTRQVVKEFPEMQIVIFSGYNEFEYAHQAVKLGVKDYLLKPLDIGLLEEVLAGIKTKFEDNSYHTARNILSSDINGHSSNMVLPYTLTNTRFNMLLLCIGNLYGQISTSTQLKLFNDLWSKISWDNILPSLLSSDERWWVIDENQPNQKFIIVSCEYTNKKNIVETAQKIKDTVAELIKPLNVTVCTDETACEYIDIWKQAQKLRLILDKCLVLGKSDVITSQQLKNISHITPFSNEFSTNRIKALLQTENKKLLYDEFVSLFNKLELTQFPQKMIEQVINQLLKIIYHQSMSIPEAELYHTEYLITEKLALSTGFANVQKEILTILESIIQYDYKESDDGRELVDRIEEYLKIHFKESICLENILSKFNFNPSYLTRIFKKYKGETPSKYLINLRIDEAKHLMEQRKELLLKDIGEMIGYSNQYYFSRIFKSITGKTPKEFKDQA